MKPDPVVLNNSDIRIPKTLETKSKLDGDVLSTIPSKNKKPPITLKQFIQIFDTDTYSCFSVHYHLLHNNCNDAIMKAYGDKFVQKAIFKSYAIEIYIDDVANSAEDN